MTASIPSLAVSHDTTPPSAPILIRPPDGTYTSNRTPEFAWYQSSDPNGNYVAYTLYLNGVATYLGISNVGNSVKANYRSTVVDNEIRLTPLVSLADGTYSWKVVAYDAAGNEASSTNWSFVIDTSQPVITVVSINDIKNPVIEEGSSFDLTGPTDVIITLHSDPFTSIRLGVLNNDHMLLTTLTGTTDYQGDLILTTHLDLGTYYIQISGTDRGNLTTIVPEFVLRIIPTTIIIPIPGVTPPPTITIPGNLPSTLYNYPATVTEITSRVSQAELLVATLALSILWLLLLLKRRWNIELISADGRRVHRTHIIHTYGDRADEYDLMPRHRGRLYISHLSRKSTLRIDCDGLPRRQAGFSTSLCLLYPAKRYVVVVG